MDRNQFIIATAVALFTAFILGWFASWLIHRLTRATSAELAELGRLAQQLHATTEARDAARQEAMAREESKELASGSTSTAIALRDKDLEVTNFYKTESTARGTWRPTSASSGYSEGARQAGDRAGRRAKIGADREFGSPRGALEA